jgi:1,4-alpha-glucan branching enzyme
MGAYYKPEGFKWIDANNAEQSIISFIRASEDPEESIVVVCNFTPKVHDHYRIGVPYSTRMYELFNSDSEEFGGSGCINNGHYEAESMPYHNQMYSIQMTIPPLSTVMLKKSHS